MNFSLTQRRKRKIFKGSIWKFHTSIQQRPLFKHPLRELHKKDELLVLLAGKMPALQEILGYFFIGSL
jgi:hypothetical protein